MLVAILADTHVPSRARTLPLSAWKKVADAELVLHAGDVCATSLLDELVDVAPVHVAMGNCDPPDVRAWGARDEVHLAVSGVRIAVVHDAGSKEGRARRMRKRFPDADVVVFGHSHLPLVEWGEGLLLVNPGSPTDRRRAPVHTMALLHLTDGKARPELVQVD